MFAPASRPTSRLLFMLVVSSIFAPLRSARAQDSPEATRPAIAPQHFEIAGIVVNAVNGAPLGHARVTITDTADPSRYASVITSGDGRFAFSRLPKGKFALEGSRNGFIRGAYDQHEGFSTAIVTGADFKTNNLVLRLTPMASLSGIVTDEAGEPVRHANVSLLREYHYAGADGIGPAGFSSTDDQGYYEFPAIAPGNYYVCVRARPWYALHRSSAQSQVPGNNASGIPDFLDVAYPTTFNNGVTESDAATSVQVHAGDHANVEIHLNPVPVLHLILRGPENAQFVYPTLQRKIFDSVEYVQTEGMSQISPGVYELLGVPAGKYSVQLSDSSGNSQVGELNLAKDGQELDTSRIEPAASIKFAVKLPKGEPFPRELNVSLQTSPRQFIGNQIDQGGETQLSNIAPGKYSVLVFGSGKRYSVLKMTESGREIPGHELDIAPGASREITLSAASGVVSVAGFVARNGKPAAGVMVALIPQDLTHIDMIRRDQSDSDGSFIVRYVIPGTYTLIAVDNAWDSPWQQPDTLKRYVQHGQALTIGALMTTSVHLPNPVEVQPK
jgi:hypothetical protein